jgi:putative ABC transport system permease protein
VIENLIKDLRFALRSLRNNPTVVMVALVALALGIGANTALFSVVSGVLIEPLPYPDAGRIVAVIDSNPAAGLPRFATSPPNYADWKAENKVFEHLAAWGRSNLNLTGGDREPERLSGAQVSADFFDVLEMPPVLGRTFTAEEDQPGGEKVVVLGYGLWQRRFGSDPAVVGRSITLNGAPCTVVGVMGERFAVPSKVEAWVPMALQVDPSQRGAHYIGVIGRLAKGVTLATAQTEMSGIARRLEEQYPQTNKGWGVNLFRMKDLVVEDVKPALLVLMAAVGLVLLIACANVANVLLARLASREREVAIRGALGAGRGRLIVQFLTESVLLSLAGGALGVLLAFWGTKVLMALSAGAIPRAGDVGLDLRTLGFALALSLATGVLFGLAPALQASRSRLQESLKEGGRGHSGGRRAGWGRQALVLLEVAVAVVLLVGAGLLLRSFSGLQRVDPGFRADGALTMNLRLPDARYGEDAQQIAFWRELMPRIEALPGVAHAGAVFPLPLGGGRYVLTFEVEGRPAPPPNEEPQSEIRFVTPDYLTAMGIPLLAGRQLAESDNEDASPVALINQTMARRMWPEGDPLGKRFTFNDPSSPDAKWWTVAGVVGDVRAEALSVEPLMETYLPIYQSAFGGGTLVIRPAAGDPALLAGPVREAVRSVDPEVPLYEVHTLEEVVSNSLARQRFNASLLALFAALALALAAVGVYGVISYAVSQRTHEVGLRMALGARVDEVLRLVMGQGMAPVAAGLALGLVISPLLARTLKSFLFGVGTTDPLTLGVVLLVLALVAALACLVPALKATRVDPAVALRAE